MILYKLIKYGNTLTKEKQGGIYMRDNKFYKIGAVVLILLVALIITFMVLGKTSDNKIAKSEEENPTSVSSLNVIEDENTLDNLNDLEEIETTSNTENEMSNEIVNDTTTSNKNTTYMDDVEEQPEEDTVTTNVKQEDESFSKNDDNPPADPVFKYPVEGEICMEYAKDKLVYSNTLGEWITHLGIDIKANKTTIVKASAAGSIKAIKNDPRYGLTVVIEHVNGYSTVYSNLLTAEFVNVGEKVSEGQTIGTVGNTASFEILDESHLHFEIMKDGEQIDPTMYLKN